MTHWQQFPPSREWSVSEPKLKQVSSSCWPTRMRMRAAITFYTSMPLTIHAAFARQGFKWSFWSARAWNSGVQYWVRVWIRRIGHRTLGRGSLFSCMPGGLGNGWHRLALSMLRWATSLLSDAGVQAKTSANNGLHPFRWPHSFLVIT